MRTHRTARASSFRTRPRPEVRRFIAPVGIVDLLRKLYPYVLPYRKRLLLAMFVTVVANLLALTPPLFMRYIVDDVVEPGRWEYLWIGVAGFALTPVLIRVIALVNTLNIVLAGQRLVADVRLGMYDLILKLSLRFHGENSAGALMQRLMQDVNMVQSLVTGQTITILSDLVVFFFSIGVAFTISPSLSFILLIMVALYVGAYRYFSKRIRSATQAWRNMDDVVSGRLQETLSGVRQVRIYTREDEERQLFLDRTEAGLDRAFESGMSSVGLSAACALIAGYGSTVIFGLAAYYVVNPDYDMTLGDLIALNSYVWAALGPALRLTNMAAMFSRIFVSLERIFEVLDEEPEIVSEPDAPDLVCTEGKVEFENVHFSYKPDEPLYRGLNLAVEPGMTVALVGHTGCGKTTLTSLLMRYWDITDGRIRIDGTDIRSVDLTSLRRVFGVVPQDPVIFECTLAENIAYGTQDAGREEIEAAAKAAEIHETAVRLSDGYDTELGAYGVQLSMGEKQRVNIARAILRDPRILIMDEATSSLDSKSEALIQKALERVLVGRTSFIVAHRLSTITGADMIVVMDAGAVVEQGRHEELMAIEDGVYRQLYEELQRSGEDET